MPCWTGLFARPALCFAACMAGCTVLRRRILPDRPVTGLPLAAFGLLSASSALWSAACAGTDNAAEASWAFVLLALLLCGAALSDLKTRTVSNLYPAGIALCGLATGPVSGSPLWIRLSVACFAGLLFLFVNACRKRNRLGGADLKLTAACLFAAGPEGGFLSLVAGLFFAVATESVKTRIQIRKQKMKQRNKRENICSYTTGDAQPFPLVPYLAGGFLAVNGLSALLRILYSMNH